MKKFLSGVLCATLVFSLAISALAISGNVSFNLSAIKFDGVVISEAGDGYTLPNGCVAPASITYTDEQGGGTTYLPVRRIGELAGVTIDWDGAVVVKTPEFVEQEKREAERATVETCEWSDDEEEAYEQFKALWEIVPYDSVGAKQTIYVGRYNGDLKFEDVVILLDKLGETRVDNFAIRLANEVAEERNMSLNYFGLSADSNSFYSIATKDGKSEIHERNWLFQQLN